MMATLTTPLPTVEQIAAAQVVVATHGKAKMACPFCGSNRYGGDGKMTRCQGEYGCGKVSTHSRWYSDEMEANTDALIKGIAQAIATGIHEALPHERYMERCRAVVLMEGLVDCAGVDDCEEPQDCAAHRLAEMIHPEGSTPTEIKMPDYQFEGSYGEYVARKAVAEVVCPTCEAAKGVRCQPGNTFEATHVSRAAWLDREGGTA